jgi:hypothetical protein
MTKSNWPPHLFRGPQSTAHPYPLEIGLRAQVFLTGAIFNDAFLDAAVGDYFKQVPDFYERVHSLFMTRGLSETAWEENWKAFQAYRSTFPNPIFQNAVFSMVIHWDWYIAKLGGFVEFSLARLGGKTANKELHRIAFKKIADQVKILSDSTKLVFPLESEVMAQLIEMDLVRNLGMHNHWTTDEYYCKMALRRDWAPGTIRDISITDLETWRDALNTTIHITSTMLAKEYVAVPTYNNP